MAREALGGKEATMKESDITPEIIAKAKEVAEKRRMEIYEGCWVAKWKYYQKKWIVYHVQSKVLAQLYNPMKKYIPIPSISDVLQKLNKRFEILPDYYNKKHFDRSLSNIWKNYLSGKFSVVEVHYWLLSALCEVLKEGE